MTRPNPILMQFHHEFSDWKRAAEPVCGILLVIGILFLGWFALVAS